MPPRIEVSGIEKRFGAIVALQGASLSVAAGEVVGLVGDNGAGKSTLMKVLAGVVRPDAGEIFCDGTRTAFANPKEARRVGIEMIYQDLALCDALDVASNFFLGREVTRRGLTKNRKMHRRTREAMQSLGVRLPSTTVTIRSLSGGQRQAVAIGRAASFTAKILIMDEPTAALGVREVERTLELVRRVSATGVSVIMISHRLQDLFAVCNRIVVMYEGRTVADMPTSETSLENVVQSIVGNGVS